MFTHSIRWRLNLWLGSLLLCVLTGFGFTVYQWQRVSEMKVLDEELDRRVEALSHALRVSPPNRLGTGRGLMERRPGRMEPGDGPPGERPGGSTRRGRMDGFGPGDGLEMMARDFQLTPELARLFNETETNAYYFAIWSMNGSMVRSSGNLPAGLPAPARFLNDTTRIVRQRGEFREAFRFNGLAECVLAGRSVAATAATQRRFALALLAAGGGILALGLGVSWWLTTRAIRPVEEISAAASRISAGNLSERISVAEPANELGQLAGVLNSTFARLESAFAQQKQFTADASHELRTPLAVIISETQTTLARERSAAEYRETVENCLEAAQQMRQLSHSLLELARFDAGQESIKRARLDLADVARDSIELIRPLARERGLEINSDLAPAGTLGDAALLHQVITNLLANAIHYNKERGAIRVTTSAQEKSAILTVSDTGTGIAPEDLPHVFKRFYRADKSRARGDGRSGLGLAICQAIVDAHGGTIEVTSEPGIGTTFTVRLAA